jgi:hypothetical protein
MSLVIDPSCEHKEEHIIETICHKFGIEAGSHDMIHSKLTCKLVDSKNYAAVEEVPWQANLEGTVRVIYEALEYSYTNGEGTRYAVRFNETAHLEVNKRIVETRLWDSTRMAAFFDEMNILFSLDETRTTYWNEIYDQLWARFEKGDKWDARDQCKHAAHMIAGYTPPEHSEESYQVLRDGMLFIADKWFIYLWEMRDQKKSEEYMLSLKSFVSKNQEAWANGKTTKVMQNKIYTVEHEDMRKSFVSEPQPLYISYLSCILKVWTEKLGVVTP